MSLIELLIKRGPRIDPYGTPIEDTQSTFREGKCRLDITLFTEIIGYIYPLIIL